MVAHGSAQPSQRSALRTVSDQLSKEASAGSGLLPDARNQGGREVDQVGRPHPGRAGADREQGRHLHGTAHRGSDDRGQRDRAILVGDERKPSISD